jgi:hypothetical protein
MDAKSNPKFAPLQKVSVSVRNGDHKLISYLGYEVDENQYELYHLADDPEERVDLYPGFPSWALSLKQELEEKLSSVNGL